MADKLGIPYVSSNGRCRVTQPFRILTLHVGRREQEGTEYQTKRLNVVGIVRTDTTGASIAFLSRQMMEWIQDFSYGRSVAALKWPGSRKPAKAQYEGYLAFTANPYTGGDLERLNLLGFAATPLDLADPEHRAWRQLYGLLRPHSLYVYWVRSGFATTTVRATVDRPPSEVEDITDTDEVIFPWSPASVLDLAGTRCRVVGVTVRSRWLRQYFRDPATRLDAGEGELQVMFPLDPPGDAKSAGAGPSRPPPARRRLGASSCSRAAQGQPQARSSGSRSVARLAPGPSRNPGQRGGQSTSRLGGPTSARGAVRARDGRPTDRLVPVRPASPSPRGRPGRPDGAPRGTRGRSGGLRPGTCPVRLRIG